MPRIDTIVIGAGQAGLATSRLLVEAGHDHLVLERGRIGERWRSERWDSLRLLTPNWMTRLPGHRYDGPDPDGFMPAAEVADRFERYAVGFDAPVVEGVTVGSVRPDQRGYVVDTSSGSWHAGDVIVATGWFSDPVVPASATSVDRSVHQVHTSRYRNPQSLPDGGVLVVGASASGVQIADELARAGRAVTLAVGRHTRVPRRYRDRDTMWWFDRAGVLDDRAEDIPSSAQHQPSLQIVGGTDDLDLGTLSSRGVRLAGHLRTLDGTTATFADDLEATTADADRRLARLLDRIDGCAGPAEGADRPAPLRLPPAVPSVDLRVDGITSVVWATGARPSFPWLHVPVLDDEGLVVHRAGVTAQPGFYVVGMRWQTRRSSTHIDGVRHDARAVVDHLVARRRARAA